MVRHVWVGALFQQLSGAVGGGVGSRTPIHFQQLHMYRRMATWRPGGGMTHCAARMRTCAYSNVRARACVCLCVPPAPPPSGLGAALPSAEASARACPGRSHTHPRLPGPRKPRPTAQPGRTAGTPLPAQSTGDPWRHSSTGQTRPSSRTSAPAPASQSTGKMAAHSWRLCVAALLPALAAAASQPNFVVVLTGSVRFQLHMSTTLGRTCVYRAAGVWRFNVESWRRV